MSILTTQIKVADALVSGAVSIINNALFDGQFKVRAVSAFEVQIVDELNREAVWVLNKNNDGEVTCIKSHAADVGYEDIFSSFEVVSSQYDIIKMWEMVSGIKPQF